MTYCDIKRSDIDIKETIKPECHLVLRLEQDMQGNLMNCQGAKNLLALGYTKETIERYHQHLEDSIYECGTLFPKANITIVYNWYWSINEMVVRYVKDIMEANEQMRAKKIYLDCAMYNPVIISKLLELCPDADLEVYSIID